MDSSINVEKIQALKKYKQQQFVNSLFFYPLVALGFGLFCTSPFWLPSLYTSTKTLLCVSIPRILSFFLSAKSLFILGNLIVIFLVRESKARTNKDSSSSNVDINKKKIAKIPSRKQKTGSKDQVIKMYTALPLTSRQTISGGFLEKKYEDLSSNGKINEVEYVEENAKDISLPSLEDEIEEDQVEQEVLWQDAIAQRREQRVLEDQEAQVVKDEEEKDTKDMENGEKELSNHIPALSTDELKRRADNFIAMVNKQIRLEAEEVLACAC